jgi:hypothetical protein
MDLFKTRFEKEWQLPKNLRGEPPYIKYKGDNQRARIRTHVSLMKENHNLPSLTSSSEQKNNIDNLHKEFSFF